MKISMKKSRRKKKIDDKKKGVTMKFRKSGGIENDNVLRFEKKKKKDRSGQK